MRPFFDSRMETRDGSGVRSPPPLPPRSRRRPTSTESTASVAPAAPPGCLRSVTCAHPISGNRGVTRRLASYTGVSEGRAESPPSLPASPRCAAAAGSVRAHPPRGTLRYADGRSGGSRGGCKGGGSGCCGCGGCEGLPWAVALGSGGVRGRRSKSPKGSLQQPPEGRQQGSTQPRCVPAGARARAR